MEKIEKYKGIARKIVQDLGERLGGQDDFEVQIITDETHGQYMVFNNGCGTVSTESMAASPTSK